MANYLGLKENIRASIINAIFGLGGGTVTIPTSKGAFLTLSSTNPATALTEPSTEDTNYQRFPITSKEIQITGTTAKCIDEIKFRRSTKAWENTYSYFAICSDLTSPNSVVAWGTLETPITVSAANIVPLFEPDSFVISFPSPAEATSES